MRNGIQFAAMVVVLLLSSFGSSVAVAAATQPFDAKVFNAAQVAAKPIIVEIHADWCPECKAQNRVLDKLGREPRYAPLVRLRIDYDSQKDLVKQFGAKQQSTLIVYKGDKEITRAVGVTAEDKIRALVDKAL